MIKFYRAFFRCQNEEGSNILADFGLDERRKLPSNVPFFGSWGRLNSRSIYPFVLQNGRMDFGDETDSELDHRSRFADFLIADEIVAVYEVYLVSYLRHSYLMRLECLTDVNSLNQ